VLEDRTGLLFGFPDRFSVPVSRWKSPDPAVLAACPALEVVAASEEAGANVLAETESYGGTKPYPRRVYVLNHPEYDTETLQREYTRDAAQNPDTPLPRHYFPNDNTGAMPINNWRHTGFLYVNWVNAVYDATPYALDEIPRPVQLSGAGR